MSLSSAIVCDYAGRKSNKGTFNEEAYSPPHGCDRAYRLRAAAERGDALFGTPDTWVVWNLTGGPDGGIHATDVTNASRTMLMDLTTLDWDDELLGFFGIPRPMLPTISASRAP